MSQALVVNENRTKLTRRVHVAIGVVVAAVSAVALTMSATGLDIFGPSGEPGPGFFPVLVAGILVALGIMLAIAWSIGPAARRRGGELSLERSDLLRAGTVWLTLVTFAALIEPFGFIIAGEVFVLVLVLFVERIRTWGLALTMVLLPLATYFLFATLLEVQLPGGTLWS